MTPPGPFHGPFYGGAPTFRPVFFLQLANREHKSGISRCAWLHMTAPHYYSGADMSKRTRHTLLKLMMEAQVLLIISSITALFLLTMAYAETIRVL